MEDWLVTQAAQGWQDLVPAEAVVLVPGCGLGEDVRLLAKTFPRVIGLDAAPTAVRRASEFPPSGSETYRVGSIFSPPADLHGQIDLLVEHTLLCAINPADRPAYMAGVRQCLRPGGHFVAIFYCDPQHEPPGPPFGITRGEIDALVGADFQLRAAKIPERTFPGREGCEEVRWYQFCTVALKRS